MARIDLKQDQKLATKGLLRPSVVAQLLGIAPKTVHAWKDILTKKIHGAKYLNWHDICVKHLDSVETLDLPSVASDAYVIWKTGIKPQKIITKAQTALDKAKLLLKTTVPEIKSFVDESLMEIGFFHPNEEPILEIIKPEDNEPVLTITEDYEHLIKKPVTQTITDGCQECTHSIAKFHYVFGCKFAKDTAAECKCKRGT